MCFCANQLDVTQGDVSGGILVGGYCPVTINIME